MTISDRKDWTDGSASAARPEAVVRPRGAPRVMAQHESARSAADFARAHRHSRLVGLLKFGLPAAAAVAVVVITVVFVVSSASLPSIDIGFTRIEDGKLVMDNPHLNGLDSKQRPYRLTARRAVQDSQRPTRIALETIEARLPLDDGKFALVTAGNGLYDADDKTLLLGGSVAVDTEDGMTIRLEDADIDLEAGILRTRRPVTVDTGRAVVSSEALSVEDKGGRIVFESRVRMTIRAEGEAPPTAEPVAGTVVALPAANAQAGEMAAGQ